MTSFRPTEIEQLAIEAKLNRFFGAKVYDRIFLGFEVLEIVDDELRACSTSQRSGTRNEPQLFRTTCLSDFVAAAHLVTYLRQATKIRISFSLRLQPHLQGIAYQSASAADR
jgi:hypothetical protein